MSQSEISSRLAARTRSVKLNSRTHGEAHLWQRCRQSRCQSQTWCSHAGCTCPHLPCSGGSGWGWHAPHSSGCAPTLRASGPQLIGQHRQEMCHMRCDWTLRAKRCSKAMWLDSHCQCYWLERTAQGKTVYVQRLSGRGCVCLTAPTHHPCTRWPPACIFWRWGKRWRCSRGSWSLPRDRRPRRRCRWWRCWRWRRALRRSRLGGKRQGEDKHEVDSGTSLNWTVRPERLFHLHDLLYFWKTNKHLKL